MVTVFMSYNGSFVLCWDFGIMKVENKRIQKVVNEY